MKTRKAMQPYECHLCKNEISKGDQYARKTVTLGKVTEWAHGDPVPEWAWRPYRSAEPVCDPCANPE
jgi:hypothetical protein